MGNLNINLFHATYTGLLWLTNCETPYYFVLTRKESLVTTAHEHKNSRAKKREKILSEKCVDLELSSKPVPKWGWGCGGCHRLRRRLLSDFLPSSSSPIEFNGSPSVEEENVDFASNLKHWSKALQKGRNTCVMSLLPVIDRSRFVFITKVQGVPFQKFH